MSIILKKGLAYSATFASTDFPSLTSDWVGNVSMYLVYPGTAVYTKALVRTSDKMTLSIPVEDITNRTTGVYYFVSTISNPILGVTITSVDYATVTDAAVVGGDYCIISTTIAKIDGSAAGRETRTIASTVGGLDTQLGWAGVTVTASHAIADTISGIIIGTESISTTTNAAGYAQLSVIKGTTVTISCSSLSQSITIDTTGLDTVDLSESF